MKKILMVAYDFPPMNTSGSARPQYFAKHLSEFGYWPVVLTRDGVGCKKSDSESLKTVEECCDIVRVKPWDHDDWDGWFRKKFGWLNFISGLFSRNRNWITDFLGWRLGLHFSEYIHWVIPGIISGLKAVKKNDVKIIWATGPRWGSLRIGYWVSRLSRRPLVVDIRDPWTYGELWEPEKKIACRREKKWEKRIFQYAKAIIFTSPITSEINKVRYDHKLDEKIHIITNGFSQSEAPPIRDISDEKCLFAYLGKLDKGFRNPETFFEAISLVLQNKDISQHVQFEFYTEANWISLEINKYKIESIVKNCGFIPQKESFGRMSGADFLVLIQTVNGEGCDFVSGKIFEYLAAKKPIFGIVPQDGGNAWLLNELSFEYVPYGASPAQIASKIIECVELWKKGQCSVLDDASLERFNRRSLTHDLASLFKDVIQK